MVFEVEFITTDVRPLYYGGDENLISFLGPLHKYNQTIVSYANLSYLRQLGKVNTAQRHGRTYFKVQNGIKFPSFNTHRTEIIKDKLYYTRKNHLRRFLTTETFGVINRLKIGFDFNLSRINSAMIPIKPTKPTKEIYSQKETYVLLQNLLHIPTIVGKGNHAQELPLNKLGKWSTEAIERATHLQKKETETNQENFQLISWMKEKARALLPSINNKQPDVEHIGTIVIFSFFDDEKIAIPTSARKFPTPPISEPEQGNGETAFMKKVKEPNKNLDIFYYDYIIQNKKEEEKLKCDIKENSERKTFINDQEIKSEESEIVRVYFIKKYHKCSPKYYHSIVNCLLELRVSFLCLENILNKVKLVTYEQDSFLTLLLDKVRDIKNSEFGFLNRTEADSGEIMELKRRRDIMDKIRAYRSLILR